MNYRLRFARWAGAVVSVSLLAVVGSCKEDRAARENLPDFLDTSKSYAVGALLCVTGPFSSKAASLEQTAELLEEYVNGDPRAYSVPVDEIPCRVQGNCGAWVGTDDSGNAIRAPVRILVADDEQRDDRGVAAARELMARGVQAFIGPCTSSTMVKVFEEATGTDVVLVSPAATADAITDLPDRTPADVSGAKPGYVYRVIPPDYVTVGVSVTLAMNVFDSLVSEFSLLRAEDETDVDCTSVSSPTYCESTVGADYRCNLVRSQAQPPKQFFTFSEDNCGGEDAGFCDKLGANSECTEAPADATPRCSSGTCCGRFRFQKVCTKLTQPETAIFIYEDSDSGRAAVQGLESKWVGSQAKIELSRKAFDPARPNTFGSVILDAFTEADVRHRALIASGDLPANHQLADSVVFLFAGGSEGALLLQEWSLQRTSLPTGSDKVFWVGPDTLRTNLLTNQVSLETIRNLYVVDPYALDTGTADFFNAMFSARWGRESDQYSGTTFDAGLLLVAANERAGLIRQHNGTLRKQAGVANVPNLDLNTASALKDSMQPVSAGCYRTVNELDRSTCVGTQPGEINQRSPQDFSVAMADLISGRETIVSGATGRLLLSPEGDRLGLFTIWRVASKGPELGFYPLKRVDPVRLGESLKK